MESHLLIHLIDMKKILLAILGIFLINYCSAQTTLPPSQVDFEDYIKLTNEVYKHRKKRVIHVKEWLQMSKEPKTVILDTRSKAMYNAKHIKGAIHLNFSDFTQPRLNRLIPDKNTRILIYCNNNIGNEQEFFVSKMVMPSTKKEKKRMLALNVPTFINLYGYGYKNVYELADLVDIHSGILEFEGNSIPKKLKLK